MVSGITIWDITTSFMREVKALSRINDTFKLKPAGPLYFTEIKGKYLETCGAVTVDAINKMWSGLLLWIFCSRAAGCPQVSI